MRTPFVVFVLRTVILLSAYCLFLGHASAGVLTWSFLYRDIATGGLAIETSGTITSSDTPSGGPFSILNLTGARNGLAIALLAPGAFAGNDDLVSPNDPHVTYSGFSFSDGSDSFNLYWSGTDYRECSTLPGAGCLGAATDGPAVILQFAQAVPAPGSLSLVGLGLLALLLASAQRSAPRRHRPQVALT